MVNESNGTSHKRRGRSVITAEILAIAIGGKLKTQIMYGANLSFAQLNEYLSFLLENGLLKAGAEDNNTLYKTTSKGVKYLKRYERISSLLGRGRDSPQS